MIFAFFGIVQKKLRKLQTDGVVCNIFNQAGDEELQEAMRTIMKQMVQKSVSNTPMKRQINILELERAYSVLHQMSMTIIAEEQSSIRTKFGTI